MCKLKESAVMGIIVPALPPFTGDSLQVHYLDLGYFTKSLETGRREKECLCVCVQLAGIS